MRERVAELLRAANGHAAIDQVRAHRHIASVLHKAVLRHGGCSGRRSGAARRRCHRSGEPKNLK
eukprot:scaffold8464_cov116-Isochrysis_galbana.AAC.2